MQLQQFTSSQIIMICLKVTLLFYENLTQFLKGRQCPVLSHASWSTNELFDEDYLRSSGSDIAFFTLKQKCDCSVWVAKASLSRPEQHGGVPGVQPGDGVVRLNCLKEIFLNHSNVGSPNIPFLPRWTPRHQHSQFQQQGSEEIEKLGLSFDRS